MAGAVNRLAADPIAESSSVYRFVSRPSHDKLQRMHRSSRILRVVSLNLGGRNTNPLEFELKGDSSETAVQASAMLRRAGRALRCTKDGPASMPDTERRLILEILAEIYEESDTTSTCSEWREQIERLLDCPTWMLVLSRVKEHQPHLFNMLNLSTLKLERPSIWEDPASCASFATSEEYLAAWQAWYRSVDHIGHFWLEEAPRSAKKRHLDVATGFAGLLLFDVMCLCTARRAMGEPTEEGLDDTRDVPFREIASFTGQLPASSLEARHSIAGRHIQRIGAHVVFAQEARKFAEHQIMAEAFLPPFYAPDGFTAVFVHRGMFAETTDISSDVSSSMERCVEDEGPAQKAWRTTASRLAAVRAKCHPSAGGFTVCLVSLHCSQSDSTAAFIEALRDVLAVYEADMHIVGMDSNCSGKEAPAFQRRLRSIGFEVGTQQDQVTVVKQRTYFQTQILKAGETDISHKDYIVSWGPPRIVGRGDTIYTPDVRTAYGVEQETKQCVRLPTIRWPFDHCSVATSFKLRQRCTSGVLLRPRALGSCALVCWVFLTLMLPLGSPEREGLYGEGGSWHRESWLGTARVGLCEAEPPCGQQWTEHAGSCYRATGELTHAEAREECRAESTGNLVSIGSEAENRYLAETLCPEGSFCWIGLVIGFSQHRGQWMSGEPYHYTRLEEATAHLIPFFPLSRDEEYEVAILSTRSNRISGCYTVEFFTDEDDVPDDLVLLRCLGIAATLVLSTVLLVLPRPRHLQTDLYLMAAFCLNYLWFCTISFSQCYSGGNMSKAFGVSLYIILDTGGHSIMAIWALSIILRRMRMLYPGRGQELIFRLLLIVFVLWCGLFVFFIDLVASLNAAAVMVVLALVLTVLLILLYMAFSVPVVSDLYQTWALMKTEATLGRSSEGGTLLRSQVRAAYVHFLIVLVAITTGALRWASTLAYLIEAMRPKPVLWTRYLVLATAVIDSMANDLCTYLLAALNMDEAVVRAKGITVEVAKRASQEVEQHNLAVGLLKAAPTSQEQLRQLSLLEGKARESMDHEPFLFLQSAVKVESARIHRLMWCVRVRAMTMPLRYQYLLEIPTLPGQPRQHVPAQFAHHSNESEDEAAKSGYFQWLYAEADGAQQAFFTQVNQLVGTFNSTPWPSDLGLVSEQFPWTIWAKGPETNPTRRLLEPEVISPGDILIHDAGSSVSGLLSGNRLLGQRALTRCFVLDECASSGIVRIHRSGAEAEEEVAREELRTCRGGAVFVPGPKKKRQRCLEKIEADYEGKERWPAAASLTDICRCMILLDDPYAIAVLVAHIQNSMRVLRVKNRFNEDALERLGPEELQSMFYSAAEFSETSSSASSRHQDGSGDRQYRDISINVEVKSPSGSPFICEIQVTLSNLAILKHADTKLYTIRRMQSPQELRTFNVFSSAASAAP